MRPFNADGTFLPALLDSQGSLRRLAVRSAGATLLAGGITLLIQVVATIVLARILTPTDFGLVAMVTTFSLLLVNFGFNGLTEAIVQREHVDHSLASTLLWINIGAGILLTIAFASSGSLMARLFHDPLVRRVAIGISLSILITSISTVHLALLKRAMRFSAISANDVVARIASVTISIVLGCQGYGYWALVAGVVAVPLSTGIGALFLCRWIPGPPRRAAGTGSTLRFALNTYGNFGINYLSRNADNLLVGWRFDAQSLGFYKKAYDLFALCANQLVSSLAIVVVAGLSRVVKDPPLYRRYLLNAMAVMAFAGMGLGACLTLIGPDLIFVLLGPKWIPAGRIFTFFGPGIGIMILYSTHAWIHLSVGRPDRWLRWAIVEFVVTFSLFIAGLHWGPEGIATAWSASFWILAIPAIWYAGQPISLSISSVVSVTWKYVAASLVAVSATILVKSEIPSLATMGGISGALFRVTVVFLIVVPLYVLVVVLLYGGFEPLYRVASLLYDMIRTDDPGKDDRLPELETVEAQGSALSPVIGSDNLPLVSILIPAYNAEEWIADTIRSAMAQTWPRTEIIVVDDGSSDATLSVARRFECEGVRVISQKNQGASAARNNAYSQSHGDYIQWLDADDLLAPDKIAKQMEFVLQGLSKRTVLSAAWGYFMYRPHRAQFIRTALWCDLSPREWLLRKMGQNVFIQTGAWLVSRELTEAAGPWDVRLLGDDDGEYFCRVLLASDIVRFVPDSKVYYRAFRFNGLSYIDRFPNKIEAHWLSMKLHIKYLRSLGDDATARAASLQYLRDSLIYFYPERPTIVQQVEELALELGEPIGVPNLSWKYAWIEMCFGWVVAKPVQHVLRRWRWRMTSKLDLLLYRIEDRKRAIFSRPQPENPMMKSNLNALAVKESRPL